MRRESPQDLPHKAEWPFQGGQIPAYSTAESGTWWTLASLDGLSNSCTRLQKALGMTRTGWDSWKSWALSSPVPRVCFLLRIVGREREKKRRGLDRKNTQNQSRGMLSLLEQNTSDWTIYENQKSIPHSPRGWEIRDQGRSRYMVRTAVCFKDGTFHCVPIQKMDETVVLNLFTKALIAVTRAAFFDITSPHNPCLLVLLSTMTILDTSFQHTDAVADINMRTMWSN